MARLKTQVSPSLCRLKSRLRHVLHSLHLLKPIRFQLRLHRLTARAATLSTRTATLTALFAFTLLYIIIVSILHFLSPSHTSLFSARSPVIAAHATPIDHTAIGTPIIPLPVPYGVAAPVMSSVLSHVRHYLRGGSKLDGDVLRASMDANHLHGALIGYSRTARTPLWKPINFDFANETIPMKKSAHKGTCFNKVRSNTLPLDRPLPDVRPSACLQQWYYDTSMSSSPPSSRNQSSSKSFFRRLFSFQAPLSARNLPTASVIIIFYNEPLSTLLRSTHSVLNRSPPEILHEVILVDDGSDKDAPWLLEGSDLERHLQHLPKTFLVRLQGRNGLMRARNVGASLATGDAVVYLDSHIEVTVGWLQPLMARIGEGLREGVNHVVVPAIDNIDADSFEFGKGGIDILGHSWGLGQIGIANSYDPKSAEPMRSPIMAGGLLAISRAFFDRLGFYDPEMQLWGGEEMEISFRIWLCGGSLECLPCSRVGHVFRSDKYWQGQVYKVPGEVIWRNKRRAMFWMDEYAELAKLSSPPLADNASRGSMQFYEEVKSRLKCRPYQWYLENINTDLLDSANRLLGKKRMRDVKHLFRANGFMRNAKTETCLDHLHYKTDGAVYGVYPCHYMRGSQSVVYTTGGLIVSADRLLDGCLTRGYDERLRQMYCADDMTARQVWEMEVADRWGRMRLKSARLCLTVVREDEVEGKSPFRLKMMGCGGRWRLQQLWEWESDVGNLTVAEASNEGKRRRPR